MAGSRTNSRAPDRLLITLRRDGTPMHVQIEGWIRDGVRAGRLRFGTPLPPTRTVAADLGVSRGVVVEAYQQLVAEGYLTSRPGGYTTVAIGPDEAPSVAPPVEAKAPAIDFGYGRADVTNFPRQSWLRSARRVLTHTPNERFGYLDGRGVPELHTALADYLNRVRGTAADPANMLICNGFAQGIALLIGVLAARGARRLAVEDPSPDDDARPLALAAGLDVVGIPVDSGGARVDALERTEADALLLTPSHQWPTGAVLSADSRAAVLRWAHRHDALIVEDDYDAEYRYDRAPIGAMQGLAPERVVYAGTASKTLGPGLRLGWLAVPNHLLGDLAAAKIAADRGSPVLDQLTFADFLSRGEFDRHLRRMRPIYRRRRDLLLAALAEHLPDFEPVGIAAGLHLVAWLPPDLDESVVVDAAAAAGLRVHGVAPYRLDAPGRGGLVFGYSSLPERSIADGVRMLAGVVQALRNDRRVRALRTA